MNILFYVEPLIERQDPFWKEGWVSGFCMDMVKSLQEREGLHSFRLITNEAIALRAKVLDSVVLATLSQEEILEPFGTNYLDASRSWHMNSYTNEQLKHYENLMRRVLGDFIPDIIITFSPVPFLNTLFGDALILHSEYSIFSRLPYPTSWFLDPVGVSGHAFLERFKDSIECRGILPEQKTELNEFKGICQRVLREKSPFKDVLAAEREKFESLVLLPLQFSGYYLFDDFVSFKSQYEYCVYVLQNTPLSVGVVVNMHPEYPVLSKEAIEFLRWKYPHFICLDIFNTIYASGQFILPFVDGVVTVSSSIGLQALLFDKKIITFKGSCFEYIADALSLQDLDKSLREEAKNRDALLYFMITSYAITLDYLHSPLWLERFLKHSLEKYRKEGICDDFYENGESGEKIFKHLSGLLEKNSYSVPQYVCREKVELFFDFGDGICGKDFFTLALRGEKREAFCFESDMQKEVKSLRFDPLDDSCIIDLRSFVIARESEQEDVSAEVLSNACCVDGRRYFFESKDPQLFFIPQDAQRLKGVQKIFIDIEYVHKGRDALERIIEHNKSTIARDRERIKIMNEQICLLEENLNEAKHFKEEYLKLLESKSWRITAPLRSMSVFLKKAYQ